MEITIDFNDALQRCRMESAFNGKTAELNANDQLRYATDDEVYSRHYLGKFDIVRIRNGDQPLIMIYIREGAHKLEAAWKDYMTASGHYISDTVTWQFKDLNGQLSQPSLFNPFQDNSISPTPFQDNDPSWLVGTIEDILAAYALTRWLNDKLPDLASTYSQRYENTLATITLSLATYTLQKPHKRFDFRSDIPT